MKNMIDNCIIVYGLKKVKDYIKSIFVTGQPIRVEEEVVVVKPKRKYTKKPKVTKVEEPITEEPVAPKVRVKSKRAKKVTNN
jgi:hypothetical protein